MLRPRCVSNQAQPRHCPACSPSKNLSTGTPHASQFSSGQRLGWPPSAATTARAPSARLLTSSLFSSCMRAKRPRYQANAGRCATPRFRSQKGRLNSLHVLVKKYGAASLGGHSQQLHPESTGLQFRRCFNARFTHLELRFAAGPVPLCAE